jgi:hypothetical protein
MVELGQAHRICRRNPSYAPHSGRSRGQSGFRITFPALASGKTHKLFDHGSRSATAINHHPGILSSPYPNSRSKYSRVRD